MRSATATFVHLLGAARATAGASAHPFLPDKRHQLLAHLAHRGDWVAREELVYLFWPDRSPEAARNNLRQLLVLVRGLGWAAELEVERHRLRWAVDTDTAAFAEAADAGRWGEALARYGGPFLAGLDPDGTGEFSAWLERERERLRGQWRTAVMGRAEELSASGAHLEAAELLRPLLEGDELDEEALAAHTGALVRAGGREQARQAHARFVARLRDELGLTPTAEIEALGRALREPRGEGPAVSPFPPAAGRADVGLAASAGLPGAATSFVGRDLELAEIGRLLAQPDCRLLTLIGPGGVGKTRLALEAAGRLSASYPDGVFFVPLEALGASALVPGSLAGALGVNLQGGADPLAGVVRLVGQGRVLVVLDNFEHVLDGANVALELVQRCPNLNLLVTSRERLDLEAEWLLPIGGLDYPRDGDAGPAEVRYFDAVQLFLERARRVRPDFALTQENLPHLLAICRLVEGSPLGLELAAVWVRSLPLSEVARQIEEDLDFLSSRGRGKAERHASLRAVFEHSWRLLSRGEQETLRKLSVFVGGFQLEAARLVAGASLPVLAALVDKSLLRLSPAGRYDRHALVSQYTRELLALHPEEEALALERHGRYYLSLLTSLGEEILGPKGGAALAALDEELENVRAAWRWAVEGRRLEELGRAVLKGQRYLYSRARYQEGFALYGEAAGALEGEAGPRPQRLALSWALSTQAWCGLFLGRHDEARRLAERGLALAPPGSLAVLQGHNTLGFLATRTGDYLEAERHYRRALGLVEREGPELAQAGLLPNLAVLEAKLGRLEPAERHVERALALSRRLGYSVGTVDGLHVHGIVALAAGRLSEARASFERGLALARELDLKEFVSYLLLGLANVAFEEGDPGEARRLGEDGLAAARASAILSDEVGALCLLGRASAALGAYGAASACLGEGLRLARLHRETPRLLEGLVYLAELWLERGRAREAAPLLGLALGHRAADYRLKVLAGRLRDRLPPEELALAEARGDPKRLEALAAEAEASLEQG